MSMPKILYLELLGKASVHVAYPPTVTLSGGGSTRKGVRGQKSMSLHTSSANASVPGVRPDSTAASQSASHAIPISAAIASPTGSSGPPPAASAVTAASEQISAQLSAPASLIASSQISKALLSQLVRREHTHGATIEL